MYFAWCYLVVLGIVCRAGLQAPADGSAGRHRPASGRGGTEEVDRCAVRLLSQGLVEEREVGDRVVDSCRQKKRVSSR